MVSEMRIGELAQKADISRDAIRLYERHGLIASNPTPTETNSYRDYPEDTIFTIELIREAQAAGFTLAELKRFVSQLRDLAQNDNDGERFLEGKIREVEANIERSKRFLQTLIQTRDALAAAPLDAHKPRDRDA